MSKTVSERVFEEYLASRRIDALYEEPVDGIDRLIDYSFGIDDVICRFEVKEWLPKNNPSSNMGGAIDPYEPIREKITQVKEQFRPYKKRGEACVLVLYHFGPQLVVLDKFAVLGAMRGDCGLTIPFDASTGSGSIDDAEFGFLKRGSMVHYPKNKPPELRNSTISAIAVLGCVDVSGRQFGIEFAKRGKAFGRALSYEERFELFWQLNSEPVEERRELRLVVYDNMDATVLLPQSFPSGPFDERFGSRGEHIERTYVGTELCELEEREAEVGINS